MPPFPANRYAFTCQWVWAPRSRWRTRARHPLALYFPRTIVFLLSLGSSGGLGHRLLFPHFTACPLRANPTYSIILSSYQRCVGRCSHMRVWTIRGLTLCASDLA